MRCSEVLDKLEALTPVSFAEDWDNVGLLCGRMDRDIKCILLAVDATDSVITQAVEESADLLVTHHPLIFSPLKRITNRDFIGRRILNLIENDICYYAMHTNFDVMGMADAAADEIGLKGREVLSITYEDEISKEGIGRIGRLPQIMTLDECAKLCKRVFQLENVRVYGDGQNTVEKAALVPGSGKDYIETAIEKNADVLITGDITHHTGIDAVMQGISLIDAGHYGIEKLFVPYMKEVMKRELPGIRVIEALQEEPFHII